MKKEPILQGHVPGFPGLYVIRTAGVHVIKSGLCDFAYFAVVEKLEGRLVAYDNAAASGIEALFVPLGMPKGTYPVSLRLKNGLTVEAEKDCYVVIACCV